MAKAYRVAILGATGAVGTELLALLAERRFPIAELKLLASPRSAGKQLTFGDESVPVEAVNDSVFDGIDLVLASAGGSTSRAWVPKAVKAGAIVVDNSSAFRMQPDTPLVVPEVNPQAARQHQGVIANPNCTTILLSLALWPLHCKRSIRRVIVSTYQSASGAGAQAMEELKLQSQAVLSGQVPEPRVLPYPLAFNLFPHNSALAASGYCEEELKMLNETRKIFGESDLLLSATCVRVPVLRAHSEAVNVEFTEPFPVEQAQQILQTAPGLKVVEDWQANYFPMPLEASGQDDVLVGRIRQDISNPSALEFWLSGDQIRKGAALNAVQIAELLVRDDLLTTSALTPLAAPTT